MFMMALSIFVFARVAHAHLRFDGNTFFTMAKERHSVTVQHEVRAQFLPIDRWDNIGRFDT